MRVRVYVFVEFICIWVKCSVNSVANVVVPSSKIFQIIVTFDSRSNDYINRQQRS